MKARIICPDTLQMYRHFLIQEEKSDATIEKYMRDVKHFYLYCKKEVLTKEKMIAYKQQLIDEGYAVRSINSKLAAVNSLMDWLGYDDLKVKALKIQQSIYCSGETELTKKEYERLCRTAFRKSSRIGLIIQTICGTGIRVSELVYIDVEAVEKGEATVSLKGKTRKVILPRALQMKLKDYVRENQVPDGPIFVTKNGRPVDRISVWREMKALALKAHVDPRKVFPHNLRHLFARVFYEIEKDIAKLADILGHSSINTTRIYIISTGEQHRQRIDQMHLIL